MQVGEYRVEIIPDAEFRLDGGAMFGVVPRNLWSKLCPPDEQNRIRMNMNCVFIDTGSEKILIETGIGDKWSAKHQSMYGIDRRRPFGESLRAITGIIPERALSRFARRAGTCRVTLRARSGELFAGELGRTQAVRSTRD